MASQGGAFGRRLSHESEALMNGLSALTKETPESSLFPFAMCDTMRKQPPEIQKRVFIRPDDAVMLILDIYPP